MGSLLSHLYTRIKGSPEDVATISLCYVLESSLSARRAFGDYLSSITKIEKFPDLTFRTQASGENNERPDLSGCDSGLNELLLCEMKFWAGLTENQPIGYLSRLRSNGAEGNKALIFICPKGRVISLWGELLRLCNIDGNPIEVQDNSHCIRVDGIYMSIVSWASIIEILMEAVKFENPQLRGDLQQLQGLCERMDTIAFIPYKPEDFGVENAKRILSFYHIVDDVSEIMTKEMGATTKGLRATPQYGEYSRYMSLKGYGISVKYSCKHWLTFAETPFWLTIKEIKDGKWQFAQGAREKLAALENAVPKRLFVFNDWKELLIPLYAPAFACEDDVTKSIYSAIQDVFKQLEAD